MPVWILTAIFLGTLLLQTTVFPLLPPVSRPDLPGVIVMIIALLEGSKRGGWTGFLYGAGLDLISGKFFGLYSLTLGLLGSLIGLGENKLYKDVWLVPAVGIFSATAVKGLIALMLATMAGMRVPDFSGFLWILLGEAVLNTLFGVPIYFWFRAYLHNKQNTGTSWKIR